MIEHRRGTWLALAGGLLGAWLVGACAPRVTTTSTALPACYELEVGDPEALFMLRRNVHGDTLVLTDMALDGQFSTTPGNRAFIGMDTWREPEPVRPGSWRWLTAEPDSVHVRFVLPLWGMSWRARRVGDDLAGTVTYTSDNVDERSRSTPFAARRISCGA